jgi:hypothetical protein
VKVLLDNCLDVRVKALVPLHQVSHCRDLAWRDLSNGKLLAEAALAGFETMMTVDKNVRFQQNLEHLPIAVLELDVVRNRLSDIAVLAPRFEEALNASKQFRFVSLKPDGTLECLALRAVS